MKQLILVLCILSLAACSKPGAETDSQAPVDVYYKVKGYSNTPKQVTCYLWNSNQQHETLELIGRIDTVITGQEALLKITQNKAPYIYAKVSFEVSVLKGSDKLEIEVSYGNTSTSKLLLGRYGSCAEEGMSFRNEYVELYKAGQKTVR